jgi:hypothetical protein
MYSRDLISYGADTRHRQHHDMHGPYLLEEEEAQRSLPRFSEFETRLQNIHQIIQSVFEAVCSAIQLHVWNKGI